MCAETINAGVSAAEIAGISGGRSVEYEWESGGEKGYTKIGAGKRVKFAVIAESGCSYLTINTNTGKEVCNNHELTKSTNVIVDKDSDLAFAKRGTKWKGENGFHHKRAIKEIMKEQAANGVNTEPTDRNGTVSLRPSEMFNDN